MKKENIVKKASILIAEDDDGHFALIRKNLVRSGLTNEIIRFVDGQQVLDFFLTDGWERKRNATAPYLLILDIRMPKVDGIEVLEKIKAHSELKKMPVIMLTTTDNPTEVQRCYNLGCSIYIVKPVEYRNFVDAIAKVSAFLSIIEVPTLELNMASEGELWKKMK